MGILNLDRLILVGLVVVEGDKSSPLLLRALLDLLEELTSIFDVEALIRDVFEFSSFDLDAINA